MSELTLTQQDPRQPTYHLFHRGESRGPFDPNGALYWNGRYHLHYIVNDDGLSYAHISSSDMIHWQQHPLTLTHEAVGKWLASGTCIVNKEGVPTIIYHGCDPAYCNHEQGVGRNYLAFAMDADLENWEVSPFIVEPVLQPNQHDSVIARWDPDIWLEGDTYYALFGFHPGAEKHGKKPTLMKSADLKNWTYVGVFFSKDMDDVANDEDFSCPNFFKLGDKYMLLCISHNRGCRYYIGEWKHEKFTPEIHARMTWKDNHFFAPESLLTPDGRRVMWAWMFGKGDQWDGVQSLPRELSLLQDGQLAIKPIREIEILRQNEIHEENIRVESDQDYRLQKIAGNTLEFIAVFKPSHAKRYGVRVLCDYENDKGHSIFFELDSKTITVADETAPFELNAGEELRLHIFLDKSIIEVFINDRQAVSRIIDIPYGSSICLFTDGAPVAATVIGWELQL